MVRDPITHTDLLCPFIAGYLLYRKRDSLERLPVSPNNYGLAIVVVGLLLLTVSSVGLELFTMRLSLIIILAGMILYFFGKEVFKVISLPLAYLLFMIPLPYIVYNSFAVPLKLFVAKYSVLFLNMIGIHVWREANFIMLGNITLEVSDDCSGMRSLMSLLALSVAFAFLFHNTISKRFIVVLSAFPIAVFANRARVIITGILAEYWNIQIAEGFFHEFTGIIVFGTAVLMLILTGVLVNKILK